VGLAISQPETRSSEAAGRHRLGLALIVIGAFCIGIMPNAAKLAYEEGVSPFGLLVLRSAFGAMGMALFLSARGEPLGVPRAFVSKTALAGIALLLAAGGGMGAVAYIDVTLASVLFFTYPIFVAAVNHLRGQSRLVLPEIGLIALAFLGVALALGLRRENLAQIELAGLGLALISSIGITIVILTTSETSRVLGAVRANMHMTAWGFVYFLIMAVALPWVGLTGPTVYPTHAAAWLYVLLAAGGFTLGYLLFFIAAGILGATKASVLSILELIFMILLAVTIVGERLTALQTAGVVIVVAALVGFEIVSARKG